MKILYAGPVCLLYENGFIRRIRYQGTEVVRMIYFALRDHNWNTLNHDIENELIENDGDRFRIAYDCSHIEEGTPVMDWKVTIAGEPDGTIVFDITGKTLRDFRKNRAGFCLLHPLDVAGVSCEIEHDDGSASTNVFPVDIAPEDPFRNIRSMTWKAGPDSFSVLFEGDSFETEDQRNWGDASFKTFCTPLDKPFPVELKKGATVQQRITFKSVGPLEASAADDEVITLRLTGSRTTMPSFGIGASTQEEALSDDARLLIKTLRLGHYRIDLHPSSDRFSSEFSREYENAYSLGIPLEVVLHLTDNFAEELEAFSIICQQNKVRLKKVLLLRDGALITTEDIIEALGPLREAFPRVQFGGGTNYNFTEINRNRFEAGKLDYIGFSMDPQEHASDDLTILENAGTLEYMVASARSIYGQRPVHLSPLTLRRRFNPYATNPADVVIDEARKTDVRQKEALGALWTFGALCSLAKANTAAVTLYQTVGNQGIIGTDGKPYPVYETIRMFAPFQGRSVEIVESSDPLSVAAILLNEKTLAVANMTKQEQRIRWKDAVISLPPREIHACPVA